MLDPLKNVSSQAPTELSSPVTSQRTTLKKNRISQLAKDVLTFLTDAKNALLKKETPIRVSHSSHRMSRLEGKIDSSIQHLKNQGNRFADQLNRLESLKTQLNEIKTTHRASQSQALPSALSTLQVDVSQIADNQLVKNRVKELESQYKQIAGEIDKEFKKSMSDWEKVHGLNYLDTENPNTVIQVQMTQSGIAKVRTTELDIKRSKEQGVEPGFIAAKAKRWKESDLDKLNRPGHVFHTLGLEYLMKNVSENDKVVITGLIARNSVKLEELLNEYNLLDGAKQYIIDKAPKFQKDHIDKLLYTPERPGKKRMPDPSQTMVLPLDRARKKYGYLGGTIYYHVKKVSQHRLNADAINEAAANDAYRSAGCPGQKLRLQPWVNQQDGHLNFLLDSTEVRGPKGEKCFTFDQNIQEGLLQKNGIIGPDGKHYPFDEKELARMGLMMKLFGDRDKVGSTGKNIMYYFGDDGQAHLMNIDPGKAFSKLMDSTSINSDLILNKPFVNVTMLEDNTLLTRLEDFADLKESWPRTLASLDRYIEYYESDRFIDLFVNTAIENAKPPFTEEEIAKVQAMAKAEGQRYASEVKKTKKRLERRFEKFEKALAPRLSLLEQGEAGKSSINIIDSLQKLTSETSTSPRAEHLRIDPKARREWNAERLTDGGYSFTFKGKSAAETALVKQKLASYLEAKGQQLPIDQQGETLSITLQENELQAFQKALAEDRIKEFKSDIL